jgi:hypothetical protein
MAAKTIDECIDEIFRTTKGRRETKWRIKKTRFYKGELPDHGKQSLLKEFGYVLVSEATYTKPEPAKKKKSDGDEQLDN